MAAALLVRVDAESGWRLAQRAVSLLVQDLAGPDSELARELLAALAPGENMLRVEAKAAMVLAVAARDLDAALALAPQVARSP